MTASFGSQDGGGSHVLRRAVPKVRGKFPEISLADVALVDTAALSRRAGESYCGRKRESGLAAKQVDVPSWQMTT
jgi:hypothetical protein